MGGFGNPTGHRLPRDSSGVEALLKGYEPPVDQQPLFYFLEDTYPRLSGPRCDVTGSGLRRQDQDASCKQSKISSQVPSLRHSGSSQGAYERKVRDEHAPETDIVAGDIDRLRASNKFTRPHHNHGREVEKDCSSKIRSPSHSGSRSLPHAHNCISHISKSGATRANDERHHSHASSRASSRASSLASNRISSRERSRESSQKEQIDSPALSSKGANEGHSAPHLFPAPRSPTLHDRGVRRELHGTIAKKKQNQRDPSPKRTHSPQQSNRSCSSLDRKQRSNTDGLTPIPTPHRRSRSREPAGSLSGGQRPPVPPQRANPNVDATGQMLESYCTGLGGNAAKLEELEHQLQELQKTQVELAAAVGRPACSSGRIKRTGGMDGFGSPTGHRPPRDSSGVEALLGDCKTGDLSPLHDQYGRPLTVPLFYDLEDTACGTGRLSGPRLSSTATDMQRHTHRPPLDSSGVGVLLGDFEPGSATPLDDQYGRPLAAPLFYGLEDASRGIGRRRSWLLSTATDAQQHSKVSAVSRFSRAVPPTRQSLDDIIASGSTSPSGDTVSHTTKGSSSNGRFVWPWSPKANCRSSSSGTRVQDVSPTRLSRDFHRTSTPPPSAHLIGTYGQYLSKMPSGPTLPVDDPVSHAQLQHYRQDNKNTGTSYAHTEALQRSHSYHLAPSGTWMPGISEPPLTTKVPGSSTNDADDIAAAGKPCTWRESQARSSGRKICAVEV